MSDTTAVKLYPAMAGHNTSEEENDVINRLQAVGVLVALQTVTHPEASGPALYVPAENRTFHGIDAIMAFVRQKENEALKEQGYDDGRSGRSARSMKTVYLVAYARGVSDRIRESA